ncbi:winged helix-turn-helix domain-containing protein [Cryptosporangium phraense]|uniref:Winged helix-turn-helix transcriptional regulator n=1 Tax=Cryptosporangium phraense TaxID=2593070 RepID=A0A545AW76_9ACTN|nr:winged helix-turn-helix domain-containing protein [Cryptosporangium phraense]TQS45577.1 winged helix-turn-helix transcriptional regulator [Cryptosporangium phraense]
MAEHSYRRIAVDLRELIGKGAFAPGSMLPPEPKLAELLEAQRGPMRQALALLAREGTIEVIPGHGRRVAPPERRNGVQRTAYRVVMDGLRERLLAGEFGPADRLPSESKLMEQYGVSRNTIRRAYQELQFEGVVVVLHGQGAYRAPD